MKLERILYVEDEPDIQTVGKLALDMVGGFDVRVCDDGMQALQEAIGYAPDLILLDVMMPGMDGPATLRRLREHPETATIPVIFLTARIQPPDVAHYQAMGALDVIAKPFNPMTLASQIRQIWGRCRG